MSLEHPTRPLAALSPATSRWIRGATLRRATTVLVAAGLVAVCQLFGLVVDWRTYAVLGAWLAVNLVMGPWAAHEHDFAKRLRRYALTIVVDVFFVGALYLALEATQWLGAVFFFYGALVASATMPRRWAFAMAALIIAMYSGLVLLAVMHGPVVPSPLGLPGVRGNWAFGLTAIAAAAGSIALVMRLQSRMVQTIKDAEQRYLLLVHSAPDMVMTFDEQGRFLDVNPATIQQSGYSWDEMKALPNTTFFPEDDWPRILAAHERNRAGQTVAMDVRYIRKDGEVRWIQTTSAPFLRDGAGIAVLVIARDITESKRQTDELRANEERFRHIVNSLGVGFYTIDTAQRQTAILGRWAQENPGLARQFMGKTPREILPPEVAEAHEKANQRALAGEDLTFDWESVPTGGTGLRRFRTHLSPIRDPQGKVVGAVGVWTDETATAKGDRERDALRERVAGAERIESLGKLVSGVAHELNNPLAAILNFTEDLLADDRAPEERIALEVIQAQALRSRTIVRDLLTYVRKGDKRPRTADTPGPILETLVRAARPGLATQGVSFGASIAAPETPLLLDRAGFEQVVTNLLTNAAQAAGAGGAVRLVTRRDADFYVVIVEDNGAGIRAEHFSRIFDPFFTTKPTGQGVGLGLSVSLSIVEAHGGTLRAENRSARSGGGARFTMRLPVVVSAEEQAARSAGGPAPAKAIEEGPSNPMPPRLPGLLVIDDEDSIRRALRRYFERRGWAVDEAPDGADALVKLLRRDANVLYDVVLCDLKMPGVGGPELYRRLEVESPEMVRRLILSTGDVTAADVVEFLAGVSVPVLEKPFELITLEQLAQQVRKRTSEERTGLAGAQFPA